MIGASRTAALPGLAASRTAALPGLAVSRTSTCSLESAFMPLRVHSTPHSLYVLTQALYVLTQALYVLTQALYVLTQAGRFARAHSGRKVRAHLPP